MTAPTEENQAPAKKLAGNSRSDLIDLLRKSGVSLVLKIAGGLAAFVMTLVAGRMLGTAGSGVFFLSLAIVTVAAAMSRVGLDQAVTRFVAEAKARQDWDSINGLYSRALAIVLGTALLLTAVLYSSADFICNSLFAEPEMEAVFRWMSLATPAFSLTWLHSHFFQGIEKIKLFQYFQNLGITTTFLAVLGLGILGFSNAKFTPEAFGLCFFISSVCTLVVAFFTWQHSLPRFSWKGSSYGWDTLWPILVPFMGMMLVQQLNTWLPPIILGIFRPAQEVGIYNAAFRVANLTSMVLIGVNSVVFPRFAALFANGEVRRLRSLARNSTRLITLSCFPFFLLIMVFPAAVLAVFGEEFSDGSHLLRILAFAQVINVVTGPVGGLLNMTGNHKSGLVCGFAGLIVLSITLVTTTSSLGSTAAALSQFLGTATTMACLTFASRRHLGFAPIRTIFETSNGH